MEKLQSKDLKQIQEKFNIKNLELANKLNYHRVHISYLRNGKQPITQGFQLSLCRFLVDFRGLDFNTAAHITKLQ